MSLAGVSVPLAAEPKSRAKRTFCSVRRIARRVASRGQERRMYRFSLGESCRARGVGRVPVAFPGSSRDAMSARWRQPVRPAFQVPLLTQNARDLVLIEDLVDVNTQEVK